MEFFTNMIMIFTIMASLGVVPQEPTLATINVLEEIQPALVTNYAPLAHDAVDGWDYSGNPNITATGTQVREGVAAACPDRLPYGTRIYILGMGEYVIEDTGGAMRNDKENIRIDVFINADSVQTANNFGIQEKQFIVLERGK